MVDYELFKTILEKSEEGYIESGDHLDEKIIELFIENGIANIKQLFKKEEGAYFFADVKCSCCGKVFTEKFSKTKIITYINDVRQKRSHILCDDCYLESERKKLENARKQRIANTETKKENTKIYIERYLNPNNSWKEGIKPFNKRRELDAIWVDWKEIKNYICGMDYHDFLQTPYWKAIAESVKQYHNYKCQLCNGTEGLSVHHASYENHGDELHHLKDLICLCKDCHEKFHEVGVYNKD